MSHEIIAIRRPVRPEPPIEPTQAESKPEIPTPSKNRPLLKTESGDKPSQAERPIKPRKPRLKESVQQATNAKGKVFSSGDKILVSAPWSSMVEAEITGFYKSPEGSTWAIFIPKKSLPNWSWEKGCIRVELLRKP